MNDIVTVASNAGTFNTLVAAVKAAGLADILQNDGPFTVFAPTDAAFAKLPRGAIEALLADNDKLKAVLTYHVVPGSLMASDIVKMGAGEIETVHGAPVQVTLRDGKVFVDGAKVVSTNIIASNGIIHVIDAVIVPGPAAVVAGD
jgi:uncharacterized surface protein with fasciclin (FAS1) repeats